MNLFINDIFIDTFERKVNILQLIRQITEDDDLIQSEIIAILERPKVQDDGDLSFTILDDTLFCDTGAIRYVFDDLYDEDYRATIDRITRAIDTLEGPTLRLDLNGHTFTPLVEDLPAETSFDLAVDAQVSTLNPPINYLPKLFVKRERVHFHVIEGNILFDIHALYFAAYGASYDPSYLGALITTHSSAIRPEDVYFDKSVYFGTEKAISILHRELAPYAEFESMVSRVLKKYDAIINHPNAAQSQVSFDTHGNA